MNEFKVTLPWPSKELNPNASIHYMALAKFKAAYRSTCRLLALAAGAQEFGRDWPMKAKQRVHYDFFPPDKRRRDDGNCISSMKSGQDGIADALGVDDQWFRTSYELHEQIGGYVKVTITRNEE